MKNILRIGRSLFVTVFFASWDYVTRKLFYKHIFQWILFKNALLIFKKKQIICYI